MRDLVQRLGGQMRLAGGLSAPTVIGWDMASALALGRSLGIAPLAMAELLPPIEAAMVRTMGKDAG